MHGKQFVSPNSTLSRSRAGAGAGAGGYANMHVDRSPYRAAPQAANVQRRQTSPALAAGKRTYRSTSRPSPTLSSSLGGGGNVQAMLSDLVELSQSIAVTLERETTPSRARADASQHANNANSGEALKAQEIERIVRRVEAHFTGKMTQLESKNRQLEEEVRQLRGELGRPKRNTSTDDNNQLTSPSVRGGIKEQEDALNELDKVWRVDGNEHGAEVEQLRRVLLAEKRQRLLVEEQTQSLSEQHAKVVSTLERRLKKQEEQLRDLISAVDRSHAGNGSPTSSTLPSGSPSTASGTTTPRHLLRQQLAQHQQTQRALQQYRQHLAPDASGSPLEVDDDYLDTLGRDDVKRTLESIKNSQPPVVNNVVQQQTEGTPQSRGTSNKNTQMINDMDDIGAFLDNITKELEDIGATEGI